LVIGQLFGGGSFPPLVKGGGQGAISHSGIKEWSIVWRWQFFSPPL
jgi:hypothetical protein